ncbi:MAG TPA: hypothetical protein VFU43_22005 [Streptosporangiaceae bacterium]|nr:hypothetical protein [Streptosporangiaceae bacterium]
MSRQPAHIRPRHAASGRRRAAAPVFVDVTGRRRRIVRHLVLIAALFATAYLSVVGVGLLVGADAPLTPWPGQARHSPDVDAGLTGGPPGRAVGGPSPPSSAATSPRPGVTRRATTDAAAPAATTPPATAAVSHPGNSHATPRAAGRTRAPSPKKS